MHNLAYMSNNSIISIVKAKSRKRKNGTKIKESEMIKAMNNTPNLSGE